MPPKSLDKYDLYTLCVQDPPRYVKFLAAIRGGTPLVLRDDFAGPGAIARAWADSHRLRRAIAVDSDPEPLLKARNQRVKIECTDVCKTEARADIIAALNFGICELHSRRTLMRYLRNARATLRARGVLVCDLYGGTDAWKSKAWSTRFPASSGLRGCYTWQQVDAHPITGMVHNKIHFTFMDSKGRLDKSRSMLAAFEYHWRLWSIAELREAMLDAGFESVDVYDRIGNAIDGDGNLFVEPLHDEDAPDRNHVVYLAARR